MKKALFSALTAVITASFAPAESILDEAYAGSSNLTEVDYGLYKNDTTIEKRDDGSISLYSPFFSQRNLSVTLAINYSKLAESVTENQRTFLTCTGCVSQSSFGIVERTISLVFNDEGCLQGYVNGELFNNENDNLAPSEQELTTCSIADMERYTTADGLLLLTFVTGDKEEYAYNTVYTIMGGDVYIGANAELQYSVQGLVKGLYYYSVSIDGAYADAIEEIYVFDNVLYDAQTISVHQAILSNVPEPSTAMLSLPALGALILRRRRN